MVGRLMVKSIPTQSLLLASVSIFFDSVVGRILIAFCNIRTIRVPFLFPRRDRENYFRRRHGWLTLPFVGGGKCNNNSNRIMRLPFSPVYGGWQK